jgi:hypothetical protein
LRKLAAAVLLQAVEDLRYGNAQARASARYWFDERHDAGLSFQLCSRILGFTAAELRQDLELTASSGSPARRSSVSRMEEELAGVAPTAA